MSETVYDKKQTKEQKLVGKFYIFSKSPMTSVFLSGILFKLGVRHQTTGERYLYGLSGTTSCLG